MSYDCASDYASITLGTVSGYWFEDYMPWVFKVFWPNGGEAERKTKAEHGRAVLLEIVQFTLENLAEQLDIEQLLELYELRRELCAEQGRTIDTIGIESLPGG